jgi:signal transduction histidine kinase
VHDSVLQTLALIQKQSEAPREVARLARGQERELRSWLYGPAGYGKRVSSTERAADAERAADVARLSEAVAVACGEVEDAFAISVQQVVVGDDEMDERLFALVQASREAMVNAAKHAGIDEVSVYAEVEADAATVFVRDRGHGFDPAAVPKDRQGIRSSIVVRLERHGGSGRVHSAPGQGTEVELRVPRRRSTANGAPSDDGEVST